MLKTNFLRHFGNLINTYFKEKIEIEKKKNLDLIQKQTAEIQIFQNLMKHNKQAICELTDPSIS